MWIYLSDSFLSIVQPDKGSPAHKADQLLVRGRCAGDITKVFPGVVEKSVPNRDYAFRAFIPRETVAQAMAEQVRQLTYGNFKSSVKEHDRHSAYNRCWGAMNDLQGKRGHGGLYAPRPARKGHRRDLFDGAYGAARDFADLGPADFDAGSIEMDERPGPPADYCPECGLVGEECDCGGGTPIHRR